MKKGGHQTRPPTTPLCLFGPDFNILYLLLFIFYFLFQVHLTFPLKGSLTRDFQLLVFSKIPYIKHFKCIGKFVNIF
jgi:hypothetical protein